MSQLEQETPPVEGPNVENGFDWGTMRQAGEEGEPADGIGRQRDERGRFVAQQAPEAAQAEAEAQLEAAAESDPAVAQLLAKYGGDTEKALKAFVEHQALTGRMSQELGQLRQFATQVQPYLEQMAQERQAPPRDYSDMIEEDPGRATMEAWNAGDRRAAERAWMEWQEIEPGLATAWLNDVKMAQLAQTIAQSQAPLHQQQANAQFQAAVNDLVMREFPDAGDHVEGVKRYFDENPMLLQIAEQGPIQARVEALRAAILAAKARSADTLRGAATQIAEASVDAREKALQAAYVASGANTQTGNQARTLAEQIGESWKSVPSGLYWGE